MTHVVTARCLDCKYTDCCVVCPVECFYEVGDPAMLVIDPDTCIDCMQCVPECPVNAIYVDTELPAHYAEWEEFNKQLFPLGTVINTKKDQMPTAVGLEEIQKREATAGWTSAEPENA
jgi:ferredoxin